MTKPDPAKYCLCTGERTYRYRTNNRGQTILVCKKCGKAEYGVTTEGYRYDRSVIDSPNYSSEAF